MEFDRKKYKQFAQKQLSGRWQTVVLAGLITAVITIIFSIPQNQVRYSLEELQSLAGMSFTDLYNYVATKEDGSGLSNFFALIETLVSFVIEIATAHLLLTYSRSPEPVSLKVFFEGFNKWGRGILAGLWQTLWLLLWTIGIMMAAILLSIPFIFFVSAETVSTVSVFITLIAAFVIIIIKSIDYCHMLYFVTEFPELGIRKAMRLSILINKGHRWEIFITQLTFIPLIILAFLTIGVGFLWVNPYINMTMINVYHALLKDALETQKIKPEELN